MNFRCGFLLIIGIFAIQGIDANFRTKCTAVNGFLAVALRNLTSVQFPVSNFYVPLDFGDAFNVTFFFENITINGLDQLRMDCGAGFVNYTNSYYFEHVPINNLTIDISHYNMSGRMGNNLVIDGQGPAYIKIDNFTAEVFGPTNDDYTFQSVALDLWIYRWTVNFEGVMPGTDMGYLFNEFLSMVGPETIDSLDVLINNKFSDQLLGVVNKVLTQVYGKLNVGPKNTATTTEATLPPTESSTISVGPAE